MSNPPLSDQLESPETADYDNARKRRRVSQSQYEETAKRWPSHNQTKPSILCNWVAAGTAQYAEQISLVSQDAVVDVKDPRGEDAAPPDDSWMDMVTFSPVGLDESVLEDTYDDIDDEDIAQLIPDTPTYEPASELRNLDASSRDGNTFDSNLQFSPAQTSPASKTLIPTEDVELLDEEVDWQMVLSITDGTGSSSHTMSTRTLELPTKPGGPGLCQHPFVRPPVPAKVHDHPVIPGISSSVVIRVCFRIGELLSLNSQCQRSGQQAVFELYARVNYSTRESLTKTQHFQFMDLFTDRQPFPIGTLRDWKPGSNLERRARAFLAKQGPKLMCRVVGCMKKQERSDLGWVLDVSSIEQTTWEDISWARRLIARDDTCKKSQETEPTSPFFL